MHPQSMLSKPWQSDASRAQPRSPDASSAVSTTSATSLNGSPLAGVIRRAAVSRVQPIKAAPPSEEEGPRPALLRQSPGEPPRKIH